MSKCKCVYATAANTPSVRSGHELGGYLLTECAACKAADKKPARGCATCNMALFARTPSGRIKAGVAGRCQYDVAAPVLPACVKIRIFKSAIWHDDGTECPVWAPKRSS